MRGNLCRAIFGELWRIDSAVGKLYRQAGDVPRAEACSAQAAGIVQALAARIVDERLREAFLSSSRIIT